MEQHRYNSNAFYQQQVDQRNNTAVSAVHPALRSRATPDSDNTQIKTPEVDDAARNSTVTTMSPFIQAGKKAQQNQGKSGSPELKLMPEGGESAMPTRRGWIEERDEQAKHAASGGAEDERTPVFHYTPKDQSNEFSKLPTPKKKTRNSEGGANERPKSPKKGLLERFRMSNRGNSAPPSEPQPEEDVPPKAQAVLGTSPSRTALVRSPSNKKKGIFSRKAVLGIETTVNTAAKATSGLRTTKTNNSVATESPNTAMSSHASSTKTPQTAFTDPSNTQSQEKRIISQTLSERGAEKHNAEACLVARSQSLNYFDRKVPPTPPAKNTPPEEKAKKELRSMNGHIGRQQGPRQLDAEEATPSKRPAGVPGGYEDSPGDIVISKSDRLSPTKYGSYGHRQEAAIKRQPSVRSLEASVVTDPKGVRTFSQSAPPMADGLGITSANFALDNPGNNIYSPSIYQSNWQSESVTSSPNPNPLEGFLSKNRNSPERPNTLVHNNPAQKSNSTIDSKNSKETIQVCFPDFASDPVLQAHLRQYNPNQSTESFWSNRISIIQDDDDESSDTIKPQHGATHSRDHSNSPRYSMDTGIFARPIQRPTNNMSPQSFHPSAMPSPLEFLPATTYTPPSRDHVSKQNGNDKNIDPEATPKAKAKKAKCNKNNRTVMMGTAETPTRQQTYKAKTRTTGPVPENRRKLDAQDTTPGRVSTCSNNYITTAVHENKDDFSFPTPRGNTSILDNAPTLSHSRPTSPIRVAPSAAPTNPHMDPQKVSPVDNAGEDRLDKLLQLFGNLNAHIVSRDQEISELRTEMRANHNSLENRLDIVERKQAEADAARAEQQEEERVFAAAVESWNVKNVRTSSLSAASSESEGDDEDGHRPMRRTLIRTQRSAGANGAIRLNGSPRELFQRHSAIPEYYLSSGHQNRGHQDGGGSESTSTDDDDGYDKFFPPPRKDSLRNSSPQQNQPQTQAEDSDDDDDAAFSSTTAYTDTPQVSPEEAETKQNGLQVKAVPRLFGNEEEEKQKRRLSLSLERDNRVAEMIERFSRKLEDMERKIGGGGGGGGQG